MFNMHGNISTLLSLLNVEAAEINTYGVQWCTNVTTELIGTRVGEA